MMLRAKEEYEESDGATTTPPAAQPDTTEAGQPAETTAPLNEHTLADIFHSALAGARKSLSPFEPTLTRLNTLLEKLQEIGVQNVGLGIAGYTRLRALDVCEKSPEPGPIQNNAVFCLMHISEAVFIIRTEENQFISLYPENLNKAGSGTQYLDSETFWFKGKEKTKEEKFIRYDLADEQDSLSFLKAVAETAAICAARDELKRFEINPSTTKLPGKLKIKPPG